MKTMKTLTLTVLAISLLTSVATAQSDPAFEKQVADYIKKFPYQETFKMAQAVR